MTIDGPYHNCLKSYNINLNVRLPHPVFTPMTRPYTKRSLAHNCKSTLKLIIETDYAQGNIIIGILIRFHNIDLNVRIMHKEL